MNFLALEGAGYENTARGILYVLYEIIWKFTYYILSIIDEVAKLFYKIAGINVNNGVVENKNIIDQFLGQRSIGIAYGILLAISLGLIIIFSIVYVIKSLVKEENKSFAPMLKNMGLAFLILAVMGPVVLFAISMVSNLAVWIASLGGNNTISIGDAIFANSGNLIPIYNELHASEEGFVAANSFRDLPKGGFLYDLMYPTDPAAVSELSYFWFIPFFGGAFVLYNLVVIVFEMIKRLFNIVILYVSSPFAVSKMVLDDGKSFKKWQNKLFYEFILFITQISTFMIFVALINVINNIDFDMLANKTPSGDTGGLDDSIIEGEETVVPDVVEKFSLLNGIGRTLIIATAAHVTRTSAKMLADIIKGKDNTTEALLQNVLTKLSTRPVGPTTRTRTITKNTTSTKHDTVYVESSATGVASGGGVGSTYAGRDSIKDKEPNSYHTHNVTQNFNVENKFNSTNNITNRMPKETVSQGSYASPMASPSTIYINTTQSRNTYEGPTKQEWSLMNSATTQVANKMVNEYKKASNNLTGAISAGDNVKLQKTFEEYGKSYAKEAEVLQKNYKEFETKATATMASAVSSQTKEELKNISNSYRKAQMDYSKTADKLQQMNGERMSTSDALRIKEQADKQRERLMSASSQAAHFYENQKKGE